jgi:biopolymer transport protein ExbB
MNIALMKNLVDYGVIGILVVMSFVVVFLWIERLLFIKSVDVASYSSKEKLKLELTNNITIISSCGTNAPYIGLLGTVLAIIITFYTMGNEIDAKEIMTSLALALKATAMGLVVAIPAMVFYNHIVRKIEVKLSLWDIANGD